jgi:sec-independent protein translocase protein TatB
MFEFSGEILLILLVALIVLGPAKLPEVFRMLGKAMAEIRRLSMDVKSTLQREIERSEEIKRIEETKKELFGEDVGKEQAAPTQPEQPAQAVPEQAEQPAQPEPQQAATQSPPPQPDPAPQVKDSPAGKPEEPPHA